LFLNFFAYFSGFPRETIQKLMVYATNINVLLTSYSLELISSGLHPHKQQCTVAE
jgi:hypothetical protein